MIHIGTNRTQREIPTDISRKTCKLLQKVKLDFQNTEVFFPVILPKLGPDVFASINYINEIKFKGATK